MRFEEVYSGWSESRLTQEEAALILGVCDRTFRRYIDRYEEAGIEGLSDKRLTQASFRRAPVDEVMAVSDQYTKQYQGWNVKHFYSWYRRDGGGRSYTWVKNTLQAKGLVLKSAKRGSHRTQRERAHLPGMMLHQDGSRHEWVPGKKWDLIVTMDDATNEHYSMFFVEEEGTASSFQGVRDVIAQRGLFSSLYTDRGSHYWFTPEAGGKVSKTQLTQVGRAMKTLGIQMIAAYSPEARGRSERAFQTHQDRLVKELALYGITDMDAANRYLAQKYLPAFNAEFMRPAPEEGSALSLGREKILMTSSVNKMNERSVPTTASALREGNSKSPQIGIAAIMSGSGCGSIAIWMVPLPSSTVLENSPIMTRRDNSKSEKRRPDRVTNKYDREKRTSAAHLLFSK